MLSPGPGVGWRRPAATCRLLASALLLVVGAVAAAAARGQGPVQPPGADPRAIAGDLTRPQGTNAGIYGFTGACASCHDAGQNGAPDRYTLNRRTPEEVLAKISSGPHAAHATEMTEYQKRVVAVYVGGRPLGAAAAGDKSTMPNACGTARAFAPFTGSEWNGWGVDQSNTRFQTNPGGLTAATAPKLALKWAFGFPFGNSAYGQPSVVGDRVFVGADTGFVYALDAATGCVHWSYRARAGVRTALTIGAGDDAHRFLAYFGDIKGNVYAVDAESGAEVWTARVDTHPVARVTGAPKLAAGRLFVPLSSLEESGAGNPSYPCCTFRGGVAAYDARTGTPALEELHRRRRAPPHQAHDGRARSCGRRPGRACGRRRRWTSSGAPCISPPATATPSRPTSPPTRSSPMTSTPASGCG